MYHIFCKSKIYGLKVTKAELYYEGSITLDSKIMDAAGILPGEKVEVLNLNNGARLETYALKAKKGSGVVCLNGPAARSGHIGDKLIVLCYGLLDDKEIKKVKMKVVKVDERNRVISIILFDIQLNFDKIIEILGHAVGKYGKLTDPKFNSISLSLEQIRQKIRQKKPLSPRNIFRLDIE